MEPDNCTVVVKAWILPDRNLLHPESRTCVQVLPVMTWKCSGAPNLRSTHSPPHSPRDMCWCNGWTACRRICRWLRYYLGCFFSVRSLAARSSRLQNCASCLTPFPSEVVTPLPPPPQCQTVEAWANEMQSEWVITLWKGANKSCLYKWVSLQARFMVKEKEKYLKRKYRPVGILIKRLRYDRFWN